MTKFNIYNSKVQQLNDTGDNYKLVNDSGPNAVSKEGNIVQTTGHSNQVEVDRPKGFLSTIWKLIKSVPKWFKGQRDQEG